MTQVTGLPSWAGIIQEARACVQGGSYLVRDATEAQLRAFGVVSDDVVNFKEIRMGRAKLFRQRPFSDRKRGEGIRRLRADKLLEYGEFSFLGLYWGSAFAVWAKASPNYIVEMVKHYLNTAEWEDDVQLMAVLKHLSDLAKKYADFVSWDRELDWQFLVNLDLFGSYQSQVDGSELIGDIEGWVNTPELHTAPFADYDAQFDNTMRRWFVPTKGGNYRLGFSEYLTNRVEWARSGASTTKLDGVKKTKWNLAWSLGDSRLKDILSRLDAPSKVVHKLIQKLELGKVRGVIGVDDGLYLLMDYVSHGVEDNLSHTPIFNFVRPEDQFDVLKRLSEGITVPLDESKFDHNKSAAQVLSCVRAIRRFVHSRGSLNSDMLWACDKIEELIYGGNIRVGDADITVRKGILSGWRWTYLIDTMINVTQVLMAIDDAAAVGMKAKPFFTCSGDDVGVTFVNTADAAVFITIYRGYGYHVNPSKFWVSNGRNEFLRLTITKKGIRGYANRMIPKLLFAGPLNDDFLSGVERATALVSNYSKLYVRGWPRSVTLELCYVDVSGLLGVPVSTAKQWVHTPAAYGGGGAMPTLSTVGLTLETEAAAGGVERVRSLPGVRDLASYLANKGVPEGLAMTMVGGVAESTFVTKRVSTASPGWRLRPVRIGFSTEARLNHRSFTRNNVVAKDYNVYSSSIVSALLDGDDIPAFLLNEAAVRAENIRTQRWTDSARRLWYQGKLPSSLVLFSGRDTVRSRVASDSAMWYLSHQPRVSIELMRAVCNTTAILASTFLSPQVMLAE